MYDTIIIGAGMSGLAAGIRLAHYDQRVCILERHYTIGGLNSFYRLGGRDYDVGLHAVTNFTPKGTRKGPLARLLRQLRFRWDDFALAPQIGSEINFPGVSLRFGNDFELFRSEVHRAFPAQKEAFEQLLKRIVDYDDLDQEMFDVSAREVLRENLSDPLLIEMILCPLMWYGNPREHDMGFGMFCVMFHSIFTEGLGRPLAGVRLILRKLVRRFRELGGELKLRCGVNCIKVDGKKATAVVLDDGQQITGRQILSSAGWIETMRMCEDVSEVEATEAGKLSFAETISILDKPPRDLGIDRTLVFFNDSDRFDWRRPDELCDTRTGVICSPNNFEYTDGKLPDNVLRITAQANYGSWCDLSEDQYQLEKLKWYDRIQESAVRFLPDYRHHVIDTDTFTPKTIRRFTGHDNGAVYGAPRKRLDGSTHLNNLHICGTDQGYVGIVGAMFSGITLANQCLITQPNS
ncbi:MAG TPA: NAD(P)/FAD-dependent oxidoreductase [Pirellulales bacterium]|nr:NAD(P)/FAD-dependent oxidoreductase [Pirellulales bacterium]